MSLILEALRKSETERRLGQPPDVLAPMPLIAPPTAPTQLRRGGLLIGGTALAAVALLAGRWLASPAPVLAYHVPAGSQASSSPRDQTIHASPAPPPTTTARTVPATRPDSGATREPASASGAAAPTTRTESTTLATRETEAPAASARRSRPSPSGRALAAAARRAATLPSFAQSPPLPLPAVAPPAAAATAGNAPALPSVSLLPAAERAALPPLKVTVHTWTEDPAHRFMLVDGQRVGEGARLSDGVVLVHIRRDGAEIDVRGRRLWLPNP